MRHRKSNPILWTAAGIALGGLIAQQAWADTTSTFTNFAPGVALNTGASFNDPPSGTSGALAFDPNNADTLYIVNRGAPSPTGAGGVYPYNASTHARISNSSGNIYLGANSPMTWTATADPKTVVVGNDGSLYVGMSSTPRIFKITNPLSDAPTASQVMGNYSLSTDDDPATLARMPAGFNLSGYSSNDLILFDSGVDADSVNAVVAVHADGSDGANPAIVWKRSSAAASGIYGGVDANTGYAYWINTKPEHNTIDGIDRASIYRVNGSGVRQTIGLQLPDGETLDTADEAFTVNPTDGSLWFARVDPDSTTTNNRTIIRVDPSALTATTDPDAFIANASIEFTAASFNLGLNGLTFSNDGYTLYASTPNGTDKIWAFDVPEPASMSLIAIGAVALLRRRRRHHLEGDAVVVE